jgi:hypothetical protein
VSQSPSRTGWTRPGTEESISPSIKIVNNKALIVSGKTQNAEYDIPVTKREITNYDCVAELVFNLDEVGISDGEHRHMKKVVLPPPK